MREPLPASMPAQGSPGAGFVGSESESGIPWRVWLVIAVLTLLLHVFLLRSHIHWGASVAPPRIEVQRIDPNKLDAIRKEWARKKTEPQGLLIDKDKNRLKDKEAPPDARYMSDRNIHVEKEQRAKNATIAKPGLPGHPALTQPKAPPETAQPKSKAETPTHRVPKLGNLGLPFHLDAHDPRRLAQGKTAHAAPQTQSAGQSGAEQFIEDPTVPEGSENLLNAQESVYYSFYARLYDAIGPIWQSLIHDIGYRRRVRAGTYSTVVDVIFAKDGTLIDVRQERSSGIAEFDEAVSHAWRQVGRFPNPPTGLLNEDGQVHTGWTFTVQVGEGFNLDYLPPERNY